VNNNRQKLLEDLMDQDLQVEVPEEAEEEEPCQD
jgi:hypothetical protein